MKDSGVLRRSSKNQSLIPAEDRIGGRPTSLERIDESTARYRVTGGKSPVLAITPELLEKLAAVVQSLLQETGAFASA